METRKPTTLLRGNDKFDLELPGPPNIEQTGLFTPDTIDFNATLDSDDLFYRVRGVNCGSEPGPY